MATLTVTTAADVVDAGDGRLSLREAVAQANATTTADTIVFARTLEGGTLVLTGGELVVNQDVRIDGDQDNDGTEVTVSGNNASRVLSISGDGVDVSLRDLTLTQGSSPMGENGGAIVLASGSTLALTGCTVRDSVSNGESFEGGDGGGIFADGGSHLRIVNSTFVGNEADFDGGGIRTIGAELVIRGSSITENFSGAAGYSSNGGGISCLYGSSLTLEDSTLTRNGRPTGSDFYATEGGGIHLGFYSTARIARCSITENQANLGGGISTIVADLTVTDSTLAGNSVYWSAYGGSGGAIRSSGGTLALRDSTVTGNIARSGVDNSGGGIEASGILEIANSIVAGNAVFSRSGNAEDPDVAGVVARSNGHNVFGSDVDGAIIGDRQGIPAATLFAAVDPETGGGLLDPRGIVLLRDDPANPALSGADPLAASGTGQLGTAQPQPVGSRPDIGSVELVQTALSTTPSANNDVLAGTAGDDTIAALAGNDLVRGLGGADTLNGGDGSDLLDGGTGADTLDGGDGIDLVRYGGTAAVVVDLALGTATRGAESDALSGIQGVIGSGAGDTFVGDGGPNWFQGGAGKDRGSGGAGRDLWDFDAAAHSPAGTGRDVIGDFAPGTDDLDLTGIDADATVAGDQAFRFVGTAGLSTRPGAVGFFSSGGNTIVRASTDADGTAELEIQLTGLKTLTVDDFYL
jgi:hypothetical protein